MPRTIKATARDVQRARADWYEFHYEHRRKALALSANLLEAARYCAGMIQPPQMTVYGGLAHDWPENKAYVLARQYRLDVHLVNPWYLSDAGWEEFQSKWQQLPQPVDILVPIPCVQLGELSTMYTMGAEAQPPK